MLTLLCSIITSPFSKVKTLLEKDVTGCHSGDAGDEDIVAETVLDIGVAGLRAAGRWCAEIPGLDAAGIGVWCLIGSGMIMSDQVEGMHGVLNHARTC